MKIMNKLHKTFSGAAMALALIFSMPAAQAALVTYNYTVTGYVLFGDELSPNAYDLTGNVGSPGESITATGTFTADLGTLGNETGTVSFGTSSGNTMTLDLNGTFLSASDDNGFLSDTGPSLTFSSGNLDDFSFLKNTIDPLKFRSFGLGFDDLDQMYGEWTSVSLTAIPVPAAVWLFGSGLLGLAGIARRKKD